MDSYSDKFLELNNVGYSALITFIVVNIFLIEYIVPEFNCYMNYQRSKMMIQIAYHLLFFVFLVAVSFSVTSTKCGLTSSFDSMQSITSAFDSYIFVFLSGSVFLYIFPGWIRGFSNTFGLSALYLSNLKEFIQKHILITKC